MISKLHNYENCKICNEIRDSDHGYNDDPDTAAVQMYRHVPDCTDCKAMANLTWYQLGGETDNCLSYSCPSPLCQMSPIICSHRGALLAGS
jgi:hypothetical protein